MGKFLDKYFWTVAKWSLVAWAGWEAVVWLWMMIIPTLSFFHAIIRFFLWFTVLVLIVAMVVGVPLIILRILYEMKQTLDAGTAMAAADGAAVHGESRYRHDDESERDRDDDDDRRRESLLSRHDPRRPHPSRPRSPFVGEDES